MNKVIWKSVLGFEGIYEVSNMGQVRLIIDRSKKKKYDILKSTVNTHNYYRINLYKKGVRYSKLIHRLVAESFLINEFNKRTVNHKDGNPSNNELSNLEWATDSENVKHSFDFLNRRPTCLGVHGKEHPRSKKVVCVTLGKSFDNAREAAIQTNSCYKKISQVCNGQRNTTNNLIFRFDI